MQRCVHCLTQYCIRNGIIKEDDADWFRYGLSKRLSTIAVAIPFFLLAMLLTDFATACSFYIAFFFLRTKTNGFHAETVLGCLAVSLVSEVLLCIILHPLLSNISRVVISLGCIIVVFKLAPVIHDNLPLSAKEIANLRETSRLRGCLLGALILATQLAQFTEVANGLVLGITMAATMLCFPYIIRKVKSTWESTQKK